MLFNINDHINNHNKTFFISVKTSKQPGEKTTNNHQLDYHHHKREFYLNKCTMFHVINLKFKKKKTS